MKQLALPGVEIVPSFSNRAVRAVTFQGKLALPIHRWYRLTPSFSPVLANDIATHFGLTERDLVLDPFSGVGTVPLCMKYRGIPAWSVELNPYLCFVGTIKTRTYTDLTGTADCFRRFTNKFKAALKSLPADSQAGCYLREHARYVPGISKPLRWWSEANLMQLVCLRQLFGDLDEQPENVDLLRMGALAILIPVSNAKHNHVSLTFAERPQRKVDIGEILGQKFKEMLADLRAVASVPCAEVEVFPGNSKCLSQAIPRNRKPTAVITSPPYPNRFSYARETRPHLFFFEFVTGRDSIGQLETDAIGGTWGKATSVLAKGVEPKNAVVARLLEPYCRNITASGKLMASYVTKYFNDMFDHAGEIATVCRKSTKLAYVIGNSKFYDHPLPSDELLAGIFAHFGFDLEGIERMRRRQSKTGLYEAVVFMSRS